MIRGLPTTLLAGLACAATASAGPFDTPAGARLALLSALPAGAVDDAEVEPAASPAPSPARRAPASEFWMPMGSLLLPGLAQYRYGDARTGLVFSATAVGGFAAGTALIGEDRLDEVELTTSSRRDQWGLLALSTGQSAMFLSAYDAFHRAVPELQRRGEYAFLTHHEPTERLLNAPFALGYMKQRTTWIPMGLAAALAAAVIVDGRNTDERLRPFREGDELFVAGISYNASVSEEALFRGYLFPLAQRRLGSFWGANAAQALVFGAAHFEKGETLPVIQTLSALYDGWLTRRNGGSIRESVFQHFWYDVLVLTATLLAERQETRRPVTVGFSIRF